jgi:hypothetical protein
MIDELVSVVDDAEVVFSPPIDIVRREVLKVWISDGVAS